MRYISTNGGAPAVGLEEALLAGLAPDRGLYLPDRLKTFGIGAFPVSGSLPGIGETLLAPFFDGSRLQGDLSAICGTSLDIETPVREIGTDTTLLELFHGPTAAFKDYGARFLARTLGRMRRDASAPPLTILVATSGDTGGAVAAAFHREPGFRVVILYPDGRVSGRQAHQLGSFGDNVTALRVPAGFDQCQALVKMAFADAGLRERVPLSSANSISLGRLLPQATYYASASLSHFRERGTPLSFIVPTGNLGNAVAALLAREMGLPIGRVLFATNENRTIPDFLATGSYEGRPSVTTLANAMDVGDPSNAARLRYLMARNPSLTTAVSSMSVTDETIRDVIRRGEERYGAVFCPHTACGIAMLEEERRRGAREAFCVAATAHPAKFDDVVEPLVGHPVEAPASLQEMLDRPARADAIEPAYEAFLDLLLRL